MKHFVNTFLHNKNRKQKNKNANYGAKLPFRLFVTLLFGECLFETHETQQIKMKILEMVACVFVNGIYTFGVK